VPADGRLIESVNLRIQEAALTGESEAVEKTSAALAAGDLALGDRTNMAYMGTTVSYGRGQMVITATGMNTELGRIAGLIATVHEGASPLQKRLNQVGQALIVLIAAVVAAVVVLGLLRGEELRLMVMTAISMAVAAIPEALWAVVTISLALGAQRMLRRRALIRRLLAVETLGSTTVICSDKTGTLTENRMTVTVLNAGGDELDPTAAPTGASLAGRPGLALLLAGAALCNDALLDRPGGPDGEPRAIGDPTETALVVAAARFGIVKDELERALPRLAELPFDSDRKRMTTVHALPASPAGLNGLGPMVQQLGLAVGGEPYIAFVKGAVDGLLDLSTREWTAAGERPLDAAGRQRIEAAAAALAEGGMRVLGVACRPLRSTAIDLDGASPERDLTFIGIAGMIDPPRAEVRAAVETCRRAGVRPVMITGDHPLTARAIAAELGIGDGGAVLTGRELEGMSVDELDRVVEQVSVYARVSPEHKLRIVEALQRQGHVVAMTGDGVNDAPALRKADIGVAMGITGTDVSKEAADMVLLDDNFATIVAAVEEGRSVYDNIRRFIRYSLAGNFSKILVMFLAPFTGMPLPLQPIQILWMNVVNDGLPGLAMSAEPAERDTMRRPPLRSTDSIFDRAMALHILWVGALIGALALGTGYWYWQAGRETWQTMILTIIIFGQMAHALAVRSTRESLFRLGLLTNKPLLGAVLVNLALQLLVIYVPFLQGFLGTTALPAADLALCAALGAVVFFVVEAVKLLIRRRASPDRSAPTAATRPA
jgi:P-type Ca2+ transporter type 2C